MPEFHVEPYVYLPAVTPKSALIAWDAFYFRTTSSGKWKIIDDHDLPQWRRDATDKEPQLVYPTH